MEKEGSTPRPPSPGRTSRSGGYHCPTAGCRIAAARLRCCVNATLRGLAVGATRLRLADAGGAGAGKCLRGSAQHAYVAGRALCRLLSGSKSSDLQRRSALRRRVSQSSPRSSMGDAARPTLRRGWPSLRVCSAAKMCCNGRCVWGHGYVSSFMLPQSVATGPLCQRPNRAPLLPPGSHSGSEAVQRRRALRA